MYSINETHDPNLKSWIKSANQPGTDFPIQNLPFGIFKKKENNQVPRIGVAIGDQILDLTSCLKENLLENLSTDLIESCCSSSLNGLMSKDYKSWSTLRKKISQLLSIENTKIKENTKLIEKILIPQDLVEMLLPARIGDFTDFYASIFHATNVGKMFRPDNPLLPNYKYIPIAYHGRSSSIVVSGTSVRRPNGQFKDDKEEFPNFGPSKLLDYELEVGFFVGRGNSLGEPIKIDHAEENIFGLCLVNDWSARDIQKWEYQPLGPFLAKSFATTVSPWIVTMEALKPFRVPSFSRPMNDPQPLPYLNSQKNTEHGGIDLTLEACISSEQMREQKIDPWCLSQGNFMDIYWTISQMITHHASNGCNLRSGDLIASGTVSGKSKNSQGCLLELTERGSNPISLPTGEVRRFLQDGDELILKGFCENLTNVRIGFGECKGIIIPSLNSK